mgnify:CR=1 FL=1|jgi:hypothetical protein
MTEKASKLLSGRTKADIKIRTHNARPEACSYGLARGAVREARFLIQDIMDLSDPENGVLEELAEWLHLEDIRLEAWWGAVENEGLTQKYEDWREEAEK